MNKLQFSMHPDGQRLAFIAQPEDENNRNQQPLLLFLTGFCSDMQGNKATALAEWAKQRGIGLLRFDYRGHGDSEGVFSDCCLSDWISDGLHMLDNHIPADRPVIIIGSSMGGWIGLHLALQRSERVVGVLGLAAAPDFTKDMEHNLSVEQQKSLAETGRMVLPCDYQDGDDYVITQKMLDDGRVNCLLDKPIPLSIPVRLLQGMQDADVPWQKALQLAENIKGCDVQIHLLKDADHRLSDCVSLAMFLNVLEQLYQHSVAGRLQNAV